jgi:uncharacterized protein
MMNGPIGISATKAARSIARTIILLLLVPFAAMAQDLPQPLNDTVSDFAQVIPASDETRLSSDMKLQRDQTDVHVVVVTMNGMIGAKPGERVETYATRLFNAWGVGDAARNDGILILVVTGDRVARIALGAGYDAVYDGRATRVIETAMLPEFRDGRLADGIIAGVASAQERLVAPYLAGKPVTVDEGFPKPVNKALLWIIGLFGGGAALFFGGRAAWSAYVRCPQCQQPTLTRRNEVLSHATTYSSGHGIRYLNCASCGYAHDEPYTIAQRRDNDRGGRSGGGGGGGGGFGGGRSSGGGGTGRW